MYQRWNVSCHTLVCKANNKNMNDYVPSKEFSYLRYWDVNNLYGQAMQQNLRVNGFK